MLQGGVLPPPELRILVELDQGVMGLLGPAVGVLELRGAALGLLGFQLGPASRSVRLLSHPLCLRGRRLSLGGSPLGPLRPGLGFRDAGAGSHQLAGALGRLLA
jgi:hypothetical protein